MKKGTQVIERAPHKTPGPPGRNDPCPCGSGRKSKHCCAREATPGASAQTLASSQFRRGEALARQGNIKDAIEAYRIASTELPQASSRLGHLLLSLDRRQAAITAFRTAAGTAPISTDRRMDLVRALILEEKDSDAEGWLLRALADDPKSGDAHWLLGRVLTDAGRFAEAGACFDRALAAAPYLFSVYYDLARGRTFTEADHPLIQRMITATRRETVADEKVKLHLALAKGFDDLRDAASSMRHIAKANAIKSALAPLDRQALERRVNGLISLYTQEFLNARVQDGDPSELPVLVLGMPRSGTTLVEQILASHGAVHGGDELQFWFQRDALLTGLNTEQAFRDHQSGAARGYLDLLRKLGPNAQRVTDKNPFNFFSLGFIHMTLPRATLFHCRRHPVDTCLSITSTYFRARQDFSTDPDDLVFYYRQYERLMAHWRTVIPPSRLVDIDYESLIADPEPVARGMIAALGLDWDPACLRPECNPRPVRTSSKWQVRQPIHASAAGRWRRYEPWLGPLRELAPPDEAAGEPLIHPK